MSTDSGCPADILLVEDNPGDVRLVRETFENTIANTIHVVNDGSEALDFVYQRDEYADAPSPDIILLDWHLPGIDGDEVLAELKADPEFNHIPVIVQTGSESEIDVLNSENTQADAYIVKPVEPDDFLESISSFNSFSVSIHRLTSSSDE